MTHARRIRDIRSSRSGALHWADAAVLAAVAVVVLLVSLPRLREFALRENESDARTLLARLGELCTRESPVQDGQLATLTEVLARAPQLAARLDDAEWLQGGAVLRRHGYLFELEASAPTPVIRAWPWEHGRTGCSAFRWRMGALEGHPNPTGEWSGMASGEAELSPAEWRPVTP